ncbi:hypothetical protein AcV7_007997 [Taiwanofungus camphoratus]|nr:hypothetical protein AcW2_006715 [Antrodia cinnamomea]KAI0952080.1 hypothetical protein AcV7_007997 [Antrodia cinnamomea]
MACIVLSSLLSFAGLLGTHYAGLPLLYVYILSVIPSGKACTIKGFAFHSFSDFANSSVGLGAAAFADVLIATSLCVLLRRCRTGFSRTDSVVRTLIVYSVNTGALTSLCAIASLVTYAVMPDSYVFLAIYFVLPELLLNSLLATLNARSSLRERNAGSLVPISLSNQADSQTMSSGKPGQSSGEEVVCHVTNVSV